MRWLIRDRSSRYSDWIFLLLSLYWCAFYVLQSCVVVLKVIEDSTCDLTKAIRKKILTRLQRFRICCFTMSLCYFLCAWFNDLNLIYAVDRFYCCWLHPLLSRMTSELQIYSSIFLKLWIFGNWYSNVLLSGKKISCLDNQRLCICTLVCKIIRTLSIFKLCKLLQACKKWKKLKYNLDGSRPFTVKQGQVFLLRFKSL